MDKRNSAKNASGSVDTFLTLMRNLEIVIMNRADFCKRQIMKVEEKVYQHRSESLKLSSNCSSFLSLITQNSDTVPAKIEQVVSKLNAGIAGLIEEDINLQNMKTAQKLVDDVINRVFTAPLITSSSNPSRDLCRSFFTQFQLLEHHIDCMAKYDCHMDLCLRKMSAFLSNLMEINLEVFSLINPSSTDHKKGNPGC